MGLRLTNLTKMFTNVKTRTIMIASVVVLFIAGGIALTNLRSSTTAEATASFTAPPGGLEAVPGGQTTAQYQELLRQADIKAAEEAQRTGQSAIPTIGTLEQTPTPTTRPTGQPSVSELQRRLSREQAEILAAQRAKEARAQAAAITARPATTEVDTSKLSQTMAQEAKKLFSAWGRVSVQRLVEGKEDKNGNGNGSQGDGAKGPVLIKSGTVLFGVLQTYVNSDEPGPILATVVSEKYKGARLVGRMQKLGQWARGVKLQFEHMNIKGYPTTITVSAVAISPKTARAALATGVNHHYLQRYGSLVASAFLEGWGKSASQPPISFSSTTSTGTVTVSQSAPTSQNQLRAGYGEVGKAWASQVKSAFKRPVTITVKSGTAIGILFTSDVRATNS